MSGTPANPAWSTTGGDSWAERWRQIDAALAQLGCELDSAILEAAPAGPFRALDVGCGAGSTSLALATARSDVEILSCDLSPALAAVAEQRLDGRAAQVVVGEAQAVAADHAPFDMIFSRHGVMFFPDPVDAFRRLRAATRGKGVLIFSCFRDWGANPWASAMGSAAAGHPMPPPEAEIGAFAFSDPDKVRAILSAAGWQEVEGRAVSFTYVAGEGAGAIDQAMSLLTAIGPASAVLRDLPDDQRLAAIERMRRVVGEYVAGTVVALPASAWIWTAKSGPAGEA